MSPDRRHTIATHYPKCSIRREWPVTMRTGQHRSVQGGIDMLLETEKGLVIIDHKSHAGGDEKMEKAGMQLGLYAEALSLGSDSGSSSILVHTPFQSQLLQYGNALFPSIKACFPG